MRKLFICLALLLVPSVAEASGCGVVQQVVVAQPVLVPVQQFVVQPVQAVTAFQLVQPVVLQQVVVQKQVVQQVRVQQVRQRSFSITRTVIR